MKWTEIITVRSSGGIADAVRPGILAYLHEVLMSPDLISAFVHTSLQYPTDFCVTLMWESAAPTSSGSALGAYLTRALRELGMVDHSCWLTPAGFHYPHRQETAADNCPGMPLRLPLTAILHQPKERN